MTFAINKMKRIIYILIVISFSFSFEDSEGIFSEINLTDGNYSQNFTLNKSEIFKLKGQDEFNYVKIFVKAQEIENNTEISYDLFYQTVNNSNISRLYQIVNDTRKRYLNVDDLQTDSNLTVKCQIYPCNIELNLNGIKDIAITEEENNTYYIIQQNQDMIFIIQNISQQFKKLENISSTTVSIVFKRISDSQYVTFRLIGIGNKYSEQKNVHLIDYDDFHNKKFKMIVPEILEEEINLIFVLLQQQTINDQINYNIIFNNLTKNVEIDDNNEEIIPPPPNKEDDDDDDNKTLIILLSCAGVIILLVFNFVFAWLKKSKGKNDELKENINQISFQNEDGRSDDPSSIIF